MVTIAGNLDSIRQRIAAAAARAGRAAGDVTLIAVSKTVPPEGVEEAVAAGQIVFGESKVQEAKAKIPAVSGRARWHFIGHLQSNKARDAATLFEMIHSVDSVKLAAELSKHAPPSLPVLLEINLAGEASKFGIKREDLPATLAEIQKLPRLEVRGLMTMPPLGKDPRPYFRQLRQLRDDTGLRELSMGMTGDFEVAIEEGATYVRVGTGIFGERKRYEQ